MENLTRFAIVKSSAPPNRLQRGLEIHGNQVATTVGKSMLKTRDSGRSAYCKTSHSLHCGRTIWQEASNQIIFESSPDCSTCKVDQDVRVNLNLTIDDSYDRKPWEHHNGMQISLMW